MRVKTSAARAAVSGIVVTVGAVAQTTMFTFEGINDSAELGRAVASAGDIDGDGFDDVLIGIPGDTIGGGLRVGSARVYSGVDGTELLAVYGSTVDGWFGRAVDCAGDVNGDGVPDLVIGAPYDDTIAQIAGAARVFSGVDGTLLFQVYGSYADRVGYAVAGAGDVNADGYDDVIVGAPNADSMLGVDAGSATVYSGRDGTVLYQLSGVLPLDQFGKSVDGAGDVDIDGYADFIVGAWRRTTPRGLASGAAFVYSGKTGQELLQLWGNTAFEGFGSSVACAGDVDFDGASDVIVGATFADAPLFSSAGNARVFSGTDGTLLHEFHGSSAGAYYGSAVDCAGDVDGDGFADLVIGASDDPTGGLVAGMFEIRAGSDGSLLHRQHGTSGSGELGFAVAALGDIDGDGATEVVAGQPFFDTHHNDAGRAFVVDLHAPVSPGIERRYGVPCPGTNGRLPRIEHGGGADLGHSLVIRLRAARGLTTAALHFGLPTTLSLDALGMPGCTSYVDPVAAFQYQTNAHGHLLAIATVPNDLGLVGLEMHVQWAVVDPGAAHALGATLSDALSIEVGM